MARINREASGVVLGERDRVRLSERGIGVDVVWEPNPRQDALLRRLENEILMAGSKFGGKSEVARIWMVQGNPDKPNYDDKGNPILVNMSYVYHPMFLGVVVRLNEKDLREWVDKARPYYEILGMRYNKAPAQFEHCQTGSKIFLGHAEEKDAYTKWQGVNIVRFLVEEGGQIANRDIWDQIRSCVRSVYPEMRAQILITANPGGPGQEYLFDRFMEPKDKSGVVMINPSTGQPWKVEDGGMVPIVEDIPNPFKAGEVIKRTRIWVPSYLQDNPHAANDTGYIGALASLDNEKLKRAYLFGDWRAMRGTYFDNFSKLTHTFNEKERIIKRWWRVSGALDWGFEHDSAFYKGAIDSDTKQILVSGELVVNKTDPVELGAAIARSCKVDLLSQGSMVIFTAHDMFHRKIGEFTWVDLLMRGVGREIGREYVHAPELLIRQLKDQYKEEGKQWDEDISKLISSNRKMGITFVRAPMSRAVGFMYMRTLMKTESSTPLVEFDYFLAQKLAHEDMDKYAQYLRAYRDSVEILPKLLISDSCECLISAIPKAIHDPDNPEDIDPTHFKGMDSLDSCRYLLGGMRDDPASSEPVDIMRSRMADEALTRNPSLSTQDLIWMAINWEKENNSQLDDNGFSFRRRSNLGRRIGN